MLKYLSKSQNDILCDLITMHKCHVFLTVVEKKSFSTIDIESRSLRLHLTTQS
jgi:hypothetical protein